MVFNYDLMSYVDKRYRVSKSAMVPLDDPVSQCVLGRMESLMGNLQHEKTEPLQIVKYDPGGEFRLHFDWFPKYGNVQKGAMQYDDTKRPINRLSSIFVYLGDDCIGGETYFPNVPGVSAEADGEKFSRTDTGMGLLVRPKKGNAVFWMNMRPNGTGDERVLHAGLPVQSGVKLGMNLFTVYYPDTPIVG